MSQDTQTSEHRQKVLDINELVLEIAINACRKQILTFSKQLKEQMLENGITRQVTEGIIKEAFRGYKAMGTFHEHCDDPLINILEAYLKPSNRCKDVIGRLIVEYALVRAVKKPLINPDGSEAEEAVRQAFKRNALPRPFVAYFLVSVRGSLDDVDEFEARPVLFSAENPAMAERQELARAIAEEHTTLYKHDHRVVDWQTIYDDKRSMKLGHDIIADVIEGMSGLGDQRMLKIILNIQNNDKPVSAANVMEREFVVDDVRLLKAALSKSRELLAKALGIASDQTPQSESAA